MKIMITGGAGFIGSHIADQLLNMGHNVIVVDNLSTGKKTNNHQDVKFYLADITKNSLQMLFAKERPEYVIHQAAQSDVQISLQDPLYDARVNILGLLNVLECCVKYNVKKIVCASSAAVYGEPQYLGVDENHSLNPQSGYGITKAIISKYLEVYADIYSLKYSVLRYSNVYGPRQAINGEGGVVALFINKFLKNELPVIYGNGKQTRDFIYVEDVVRANIQALSLADNEVLNISSGTQTSVMELFILIKLLTNSRQGVKFSKARKGDILHSYLRNDKAQEKLSWQPQWKLKDGLLETISYYEKMLM